MDSHKKTKKALILVDLQNDFFPGGTLAIPKAPEILPAINKLLTYPFALIIATKDWHPSDHGSFAKIHNKQPGEKIILNGLEQILWPIHCVNNTLGAEFHPGWDSRKVDKIIYKGTDKALDSYSTFFDNGHLKSTGLTKYLKESLIDEVYIAGLATDYCVKYSVLDAIQEGFPTHIVIDACRGVDLKAGDSQKAIDEMQATGAKTITSDALFKPNLPSKS